MRACYRIAVADALFYAGAMRGTQGSVICSRCGKLVSIEEERCPFCGAWRPGLYGYAPALRRFFGGRFEFTRLVIAASVTLYVISLLLQPEAIFSAGGLFNLLSPGSRALYQLGMTGGLAWESRWWWTLFTAIYLHGGLLHIFFNVMWIRNLGPGVNEAYGPARGFVVFSLSGALGFLCSNLISGAPSIGASGSIFGLLAALIAYGRRRGSMMLTRQLWQWAIVLFIFGFLMSGVNNIAHAGGFAGGWLVATAMRPGEDRREGIGVQLIALALLIVTALGFVLSFVQVTRALQ